MLSGAKKVLYYSASASSLGGFIQSPTKQSIPTQSSVSLPSVGGSAQHQALAFRVDDIVSCTASSTHVSGYEATKDGPWTAQITATVEGLNILRVVTADLVVAQLSIEFTAGQLYPTVSLAGSHFENLKIAGFDPQLRYDAELLQLRAPGDGTRSTLTWPNFRQTGQAQAATLVKVIHDDKNGSAFKWLSNRFDWMDKSRIPEGSPVLCSIVDGIDAAIPGNSFGHVIDIPNFGRLYLGELIVQRNYAQLSMIRAELGCATSGVVSASKGEGGGTLVPP